VHLLNWHCDKVAPENSILSNVILLKTDSMIRHDISVFSDKTSSEKTWSVIFNLRPELAIKEFKV
jgi:hypothetical protein